MNLTTTWMIGWMRLSAEVIAENRSDLNTLDREIGDGDHGENMDRGFQAIAERLAVVEAESVPADVLKLVASTLISTVGGASGPLYGTAFLKAAVAAAGLSDVDSAGTVAFLTAARDGIVLRGKAVVGDKTMIDAWTPAVEAAAACAADGGTPQEILRAAADAADQGAVDTEPLVARKGRASYLGERARGHRDPGAESTRLLLRAAVNTVTI
ncbi:dihydroxyacetone kinase subunit DhaL [Cryobacterium sp. CG_9.6]|uniref:dihydroxyacetone kinase subunit DhaL n=1 Tax=Cryobacterium sp. CG_9.6 TaxID=2760710 RepID=UPI0024739783|nr:dihydroxyacetone kinase subunit DhaL [Cryobacterium sp. CG_9.6]MDH6237001.1 dihydroxyacetone kinase-like protein [Cryobacterium sp. CG_9.6]